METNQPVSLSPTATQTTIQRKSSCEILEPSFLQDLPKRIEKEFGGN